MNEGGDNQELRRFVYAMLDPEKYGLSVTAEVRNYARRVLGISNYGERSRRELTEQAQEQGFYDRGGE